MMVIFLLIFKVYTLQVYSWPDFFVYNKQSQNNNCNRYLFKHERKQIAFKILCFHLKALALPSHPFLLYTGSRALLIKRI